MRILNAGDKCTQLDLNSKLIGDLFLIINVFSFSLKEQTSFRTEITVPQIHIYTCFKSYYTESYPVLHIKKITNLQPDQHSL